jgi:hypothetical protein
MFYDRARESVSSKRKKPDFKVGSQTIYSNEKPKSNCLNTTSD